ncbi:unnamed protein product, partial [Mesorhabditis belari]|uniref:Uncharacterized protein n=1 Tax=Mesorhabditis belari TaxID=2138241 RepID=A0AAF3FMH9_9BILA
MESPILTTPIHSLSPELDFCARLPMVNFLRSMSPLRDIPLRQDAKIVRGCGRLNEVQSSSPGFNRKPWTHLVYLTKETQQNKSKALSTSMLCPDNSHNFNDVENIEESEDRLIVSLMKTKDGTCSAKSWRRWRYQQATNQHPRRPLFNLVFFGTMSHSSEDREQPGERRVAQGGQPNEDDLEGKVLNIQYKRFYVDAKQNKRGRFIKIAEMGNNHKSRIILTMSAAVSLGRED